MNTIFTMHSAQLSTKNFCGIAIRPHNHNTFYLHKTNAIYVLLGPENFEHFDSLIV